MVRDGKACQAADRRREDWSEFWEFRDRKREDVGSLPVNFTRAKLPFSHARLCDLRWLKRLRKRSGQAAGQWK